MATARNIEVTLPSARLLNVTRSPDSRTPGEIKNTSGSSVGTRVGRHASSSGSTIWSAPSPLQPRDHRLLLVHVHPQQVAIGGRHRGGGLDRDRRFTHSVASDRRELQREHGRVGDPVQQHDRPHPLLRVEADVRDEAVQAAGVLDPDHLVLAGRVPGDAKGRCPGVVTQVAGLVHLLHRLARQDLRPLPPCPVLPELEGEPAAQILDARPESPFGPHRRRERGQIQLVGQESSGRTRSLAARSESPRSIPVAAPARRYALTNEAVFASSFDATSAIGSISVSPPVVPTGPTGRVRPSGRSSCQRPAPASTGTNIISSLA